MTAVPDGIRWYEDMLVTPQHVDAVAGRLEALIAASPGRHHPHPWGIVQADVAVKDHLVTLKAIDAVMPGGIHVTVGADGSALQLDLRPFLAPRRRRLMVHLGVSLEQRANPPSTRFVPDGTGRILGDDAMPVERSRRRVALFAGDPPAPSQYASLPILEVSLDRAAIVATDFIPPMLQVAPGSPLAERCSAVAERVRADIGALVNGSHAARASSGADVRGQIAPAIAALPPYEVLLTSRPHPLALYLELCRVAAAVAALRGVDTPPRFPTYQHDDVRTAFEPVLRSLLGEIEVPSVETFRTFTFQREGPCFWLAPDQSWSAALAGASGAELILAMEGVDGEAQAERWGAQCVIAGRSVIRTLLSRRVLGIARRRTSPPHALSLEPDTYVFKLQPDAAMFNPGEDLIVLSDLPGITPASLTLYVVQSGGARHDGSST